MLDLKKKAFIQSDMFGSGQGTQQTVRAVLCVVLRHVWGAKARENWTS